LEPSELYLIVFVDTVSLPTATNKEPFHATPPPLPLNPPFVTELHQVMPSKLYFKSITESFPFTTKTDWVRALIIEVGPVIFTIFAEIKFVLIDPTRSVLATMDPAVNVEIVPEFVVIVPEEIALVAREPMDAVAREIDPVDKLFTFNEPTFKDAVEMEFVLIVETLPNPNEAVPEESVLV
jgi:hypothetical protein